MKSLGGVGAIVFLGGLIAGKGEAVVIGLAFVLLSAFCKKQEPVAVAVVRTEVQAAIVAERFVLPAICAQADRLFLVVFERHAPDRMFHITAIGPAPEGVGVAAARTVPMDELDCSGFRCPFCGTGGGYVRCGRCKMPICRQRVTGRDPNAIFTCRDSCGKSGGRISPTLTEATGADGGQAGIVSVRQRGFIVRGDR